LAFPLNKYLTEVEVHDAISHLVFRGETSNMTDGFSLARKILTEEGYGIRPDIPRTILVIAAGSPADPNSMQTEVDIIKSQNVRILVVGVGEKVSRSRI